MMSDPLIHLGIFHIDILLLILDYVTVTMVTLPSHNGGVHQTMESKTHEVWNRRFLSSIAANPFHGSIPG